MSTNDPLRPGSGGAPGPTPEAARPSGRAGPPGGNIASLGLIQIFRIASGVAVNVMVMRAVVTAQVLHDGIYPRMSRYLGQVALAGAELRFTGRVLLALSIPASVGGILTLTLTGPILRITFPALAMGGAILTLPSPHVLATIVVGVAIYAGGAMLTGAIHRSDLGQLRAV